MRICICGGGNLGHVTAGMMALHGENEVAILTRHPEKWATTIGILENGKQTDAHLALVTSQAREAIPRADIVMLCLPGFAIREELQRIKPWLSPQTAVGAVFCSTGFFFEAHRLLPSATPLFGFQRVPYISRIVDYGRLAELKGRKRQLVMAVENIPQAEAFGHSMAAALDTPIRLAGSFYEVSLSNSNPLLHPARLYTLFKDWHEGVFFPHNPQFYGEWTVEASELYIAMDGEFQALLGMLPVAKGSIPSVLEYYESKDARSLTEKISHIPAFKGILSPMLQRAEGFVPDFTSRYFTEDFPFGMRFIVETAHSHHCPIPTIERTFEWGMEKVTLPHPTCGGRD